MVFGFYCSKCCCSIAKHDALWRWPQWNVQTGEHPLSLGWWAIQRLRAHHRRQGVSRICMFTTCYSLTIITQTHLIANKKALHAQRCRSWFLVWAEVFKVLPISVLGLLQVHNLILSDSLDQALLLQWKRFMFLSLFVSAINHKGRLRPDIFIISTLVDKYSGQISAFHFRPKSNQKWFWPKHSVYNWANFWAKHSAWKQPECLGRILWVIFRPNSGLKIWPKNATSPVHKV